MKRGQVTIFVIVGVLIVIAISGFYVLRNVPSTESYDEEVMVLRDNILDCFSSQYGFVIESNAYQGGYAEVPSSKTFTLSPFFIPYYYVEGEDYLPSIVTLEKQLSIAAVPFAKQCIATFNNETFLLSYKDFDIDTEITSGKVIFTTNLRLSVQYYNKTVIVDFRDSEVIIDSAMKDMHELSEIIVNQATSDPQEWIDITEIYEEAIARDLNVSIIDIDEEDETYLFILESRKPDFYPSTYQFLEKFNLIEIPFPSSVG